uniref:GATA-type domain-containing protein n=1 Tax=Parastrongyloides trichosuri TaxID=131310 RepID=A0A0N5A514_PARTI
MDKSSILNNFNNSQQMSSYSTMTYNSDVLNYHQNISFNPYTNNMGYFNEYVPVSNMNRISPVEKNINNKNNEAIKSNVNIPSPPSTIENSTPPTYSPSNEKFTVHPVNSPEIFIKPIQQYDFSYELNSSNYTTYNPNFQQQYPITPQVCGTQVLQKYSNNIDTNSQYQYQSSKDKDEFKRRPYTKHNRMSIHANSICCNCGTTNTTLWRRSESGEPECNPCNLYYRANGKPRPQHLMKKTILRRARRRPAVKNYSDNNEELLNITIQNQQLPNEFTEYFPSFQT